MPSRDVTPCAGNNRWGISNENATASASRSLAFLRLKRRTRPAHAAHCVRACVPFARVFHYVAGALIFKNAPTSFFIIREAFMSIRANTILTHHRFSHSLGAPLARVRGVIAKVFPAPENHHGANHEHFTVKITDVLKFVGSDEDISGQTVFIAVRFGDSEGLDQQIDGLEAGNDIEVQGEYISSAEAYPTEDNNPPLPVIHFTHHPVGYVLYRGEHYS